MASLTQWTWVWASSRKTGKPQLLRSMGSQSQTTQQRELNKAKSFLRMQPRPLCPFLPQWAFLWRLPRRFLLLLLLCLCWPACWVCPFPLMFQGWSRTLPWCKSSLILQNLIAHLSHDYNSERHKFHRHFDGKLRKQWWKITKGGQLF